MPCTFRGALPPIRHVMVRSNPMQSTPVVAMRSSKPPDPLARAARHAGVRARLVHHLLDVGLGPHLPHVRRERPPQESICTRASA